MAAITEIGEIGIAAAGRYVVLRPSLRAMAALGAGSEIVRKFVDLYAPPPDWPHAAKPWARDRFFLALEVLDACTDETLDDLTGHMGSRWGTWVAGPIPPEHVVALAQSLMRYGVVGVVPELEGPKDDNYSTEFVPRELVATAVAHLGMREDDAWNLTVTSFILAMRSKFPRTSGPGSPAVPTKAEFNKTMDWLDQINGAR